MAALCFTRKDNGPTIEEFIKQKKQYGQKIGRIQCALVSKMRLTDGISHLTISS